mgnify:CR=1 FL=1
MVGSNTFERSPTFEEYLEKEKQYIKQYVEHEPEYIGVMVEPSTMMKRVGLDPRRDIGKWNWTKLVKETTELVKNKNSKIKTVAVVHLGELTHATDFVYSLLENPSLDIIGINIYGIPTENKLKNMERIIPQINKYKEVWIWETWWSTQKNETEFYAWFRDCYWQDINSKWIRVMTYFAQNHNIKMMSPFFTEQFVYCNEKCGKPLEEQFNEMIKAIEHNERTPTFYVYKDLIKEVRNSANISVIIKRPKERYLYMFDREICPTFGDTVIIGGITIKVNVMSTGEISVVEFYIDRIQKYNDTEQPYEWFWDEFAIGKHEIKAVAYDVEGNRGENERDVIIFNFGG